MTLYVCPPLCSCPHGIRCTFAHGPTELSTFMAAAAAESVPSIINQGDGVGVIIDAPMCVSLCVLVCICVCLCGWVFLGVCDCVCV